MIEIRMSFATVGEAIGAARDLAAAFGGIVPTSRPANVVDITEGFSFTGATSATPVQEPGTAEREAVAESSGASDDEAADGGSDKPRRRRRTKAEMEAARAAESAGVIRAEIETHTASELAEGIILGEAAEDAAEPEREPEVRDDPAPAETPAEAAPVEAKVRTKDEADAFFRTVVRARVSDLMATIGQDAAKQYVEKFAKRISEIPAERYDEFVAGADAILSGAGA